MRKTITIFLLSISSLLSAQNFEGTLTYSVDFELSQNMLDMGLTKEMMKSKMLAEGTWADTIKTSYKNGFYRSHNLSANRSWVIYRPDTKKIYSFQNGETSDLCMVTDTTIDLEEKMTGEGPNLTLLDTLTEYKDYRLKTVHVKWKSGNYYYLFDEDHFNMDPELFEGHIYDAWYDYLKLSGSLPVKIIKEAGKMMTITMSLVDASETRIEDSVFQIPELVEDEELSSFDIGTGKMMRIKE